MNLLFQKVKFLLPIAFLLLSGCSWLDSFGDDEEDKFEPAKLSSINEEVKLRRVWKLNVGKGQGEKYNRLKPAHMNGKIFAASNDGVVVAVNAESGATLWKLKTDYAISGGVGASNGLVLVGTENSEVIAFSESDGSELWKTKVSSEVLSTPATNGIVVVVQSVDGALVALNARTGEQRWIYENSVPALSLRGNSSPRIIENFVIAALDNGSVVSIALDNGTLRWEERVSIPTGRSEIDRMVDIDGDLALSEAGMLLTPSYQGYFAAIDTVTGQTRWRAEDSTYVGAGSGFGNLYLVSDEDTVKAYKFGQPDIVWENNLLKLRRLSSPLGFSNYVAVGDADGYLHLLSQVDGRFVGRTKVDGAGIRANMLNLGNTLYVYGNSGDLVALRVQ